MGKFKDITGQKFGKLTVLYRCNQKRNGRYYWHCKCDCGNEKDIMGKHLTSGATKSCGCLIKSANDIIGKKFGKLTVISETSNRKNGKILYLCQCECGNTKLVASHHLKEGKVRSCGCLLRSEHIGQKYGKLTIIKEIKYPYYLCQCECGEKRQVLLSSLQSGGVKTCKNCYQKIGRKGKDITNQKFGRLKALYPTEEKTKGGSIIWHCICDCGNEKNVALNDLTKGNVKSCGCLSSFNNFNISNILNKANISFKSEYPILNKKYRFDFFVNNKYFIEYDGNQHFRYDASGWNTKKSFQKRRESDLIKNKYCFDNNIPIIRIPYDAEYTINDLKLETTRFLLTPENEKEYYESRSA